MAGVLVRTREASALVTRGGLCYRAPAALRFDEVILSVLGIGIPPEIRAWGNIMAEGRTMVRVLPHDLLFPGAFLTPTGLAVDRHGDGRRDALDSRVRRPL